MSAVSSDHIQTGEQNRVESDQQEAGILHPHTVFVILDSAETLNLLQWVRKFLDLPNSVRKSTDLRSQCSSVQKQTLVNRTEDMV